MKPNCFKQLLAAGKIPIGHMVREFCTRGIPQILEAAGIDFAVVDMEQTGFTMGDIADMMAWFKATRVAPFVRIPQIQYHFIARALDAGALGVMAPNVRSAAEARTVIDAAKYEPLGTRGVALGGANTDFKAVNPIEFMDYSNDNTTIICQIESQEGLDNLEEIAAVPGVDVLWVGHFDLTQSLGIVGQLSHERFLAALKRVVETANKYRLGAGIQTRDLAQAEEWMEIGFNVISYSSDLSVFIVSMTEGVAGLRKLVGR